ncbi:MAG: Uma2 family endonuclease [Chloroflexota bacterium]
MLIERESESPSPERVWQMSVAQYHAMIQAGILTEEDPVEFLEGRIIEKMPKNPLHSAVTTILFAVLEALLPDGWFIRSQEPITTEDSEPEPDIAIVQGDMTDYFYAHPQPEQVGILIEVSDSTLSQDRASKMRIYARAGIQTYWIVNLQEMQVEVYAAPTENEDYNQTSTFLIGDTIPVKLKNQNLGTISVADLFPTK